MLSQSFSNESTLSELFRLRDQAPTQLRRENLEKEIVHRFQVEMSEQGYMLRIINDFLFEGVLPRSFVESA